MRWIVLLLMLSVLFSNKHGSPSLHLPDWREKSLRFPVKRLQPIFGGGSAGVLFSDLSGMFYRPV